MLTISLAYALTLGLPSANAGDIIFGICNYTPNDIQVTYNIISQTSNITHTTSDIQAYITLDGGRCVKGYRSNVTNTLLSSSSTAIQNKINSFILGESTNLDNITPGLSIGSDGSYSITG